jgi:hypothetical protein
MDLDWDWSEYSHEFEDEGTLRSLIIPATNLGDWQKFFDWIIDQEFGLEYTIDGDPSDFPGNVQEAFSMAGEYTCGYRFNIGGVMLHGVVYKQEFADEIEMDLDPVDLKGQPQFDVLTTFMQEVANELEKEVILTHELAPDEVILIVEPSV